MHALVPTRTPSFLPWLFPSLMWRGDGHENVLYLTFDDGPVPGPTEFVLDTLQSHTIPGTFFCIGDNVAKHGDIFKKIIAAGHGVGNHTFNHLNGWKTQAGPYLDNVQRCETEFEKSHTLPVLEKKLFRPPYGRITPQQVKLLSPLYRIVMWDVLTLDYEKRLHHETCLRNTLRAIRPGSIIVFHDSVKAEKNLRYVLPRVIQQGLDMGYRFKALEP